MAPYQAEFNQVFYSKGPSNGKLSPAQVREALMATGVAQGVLRCIWELSDIDKDGQLDMDEFAVAMYLCRQAQRGQPMPQALPSQVVPPSKKSYIVGNPF